LVKFGRLVSSAFIIYEQRERDASVLAEDSRVIGVAEPNRRQADSALFEFLLMGAQLRDVLAAEDSTIVPQERDHRWPLLPERAESHLLPVSIGQRDRRECLSELHCNLAERQGFEPWIRFRVYTLSKRAPSATRPSLRLVRQARPQEARPFSILAALKRRVDAPYAVVLAQNLSNAAVRSAAIAPASRVSI
jgi:hypothetical protein